MAGLEHLLTQWNHLVWFQVLTYAAVTLAVVLGVVAAGIARRQPHPLPRRIQVAGVLYGIYLLCLIGVALLGPRSFGLLFYMAVLAIWLLALFIQRLRGLNRHTGTSAHAG